MINLLIVTYFKLEDLVNNINFNSSNISTSSFIFSIILSFALSSVLARFYRSQSRTISNPDSLARIFPILGIATTIIIAVVKSSLALSLGLVGALSIVRFRTPIKEPEELTYIFFSNWSWSCLEEPINISQHFWH